MVMPRKFTDTEKWCSGCEQMLPHAKFNLCSSEVSGLQSRCRNCQPQTKRTRDQHREHTLQKYGLTLEDYDQLVEEQDGVCAICKGTDFGKHGRMFVDHNHETGEIRGLLCNRCNSGLGLFKDNTASLLNAIQYLQRSSK